MQKLMLEPCLKQKDRLPMTGRQIIAQYDGDTIVVYQAYRPEIGHFAARHGYLGDGFSLDRMSWIKTSFLWMMYRSGWGTKEGQEVILAIWLKRSAFQEILKHAVLSCYEPRVDPSEDAWQRKSRRSLVRLQWDPDRSPAGGPMHRRTIQLGLRGKVLASYVHDWIVHIEDFSSFVQEQRGRIGQPGLRSEERYGDLTTPRETVYPILDPEIAARIDLSEA